MNKTINFKGNKIVKYKDGFMAYYRNAVGEFLEKSFKSLYSAKKFLNHASC